MQTLSLSSFSEIQPFMDAFRRADAALERAVEKDSVEWVRQAFQILGASPAARGRNGLPLILEAALRDQGEALLFEFLGCMPGVCVVPMGPSRPPSVWEICWGEAPGVHAIELDPKTSEQAAAVQHIVRLVNDVVMWRRHHQPAHASISVAHLMAINRNLVEGAKRDDLPMVRQALMAGASTLATDENGRPALQWACDAPHHAQIMGALFFTNPSLHREDHRLLGVPEGRISSGGTAPFVERQPSSGGESGPEDEVGLVDPISPVLVAHFKTLSDWQEAMSGLFREMAFRNQFKVLRWPGLLEFERVLLEKFNAHMAASDELPSARPKAVGSFH